MATNQYEVLGKTPDPTELKKLAGNDTHLELKNLMRVTGKWQFYTTLTCL